MGLSMILSVVSCKAEDYEIQALEIGCAFDSADGGNHKSEYEPWSSENVGIFQYDDVPQEAIITFNELDYKGTYYRSERNELVNYQIDYYSVGDVKFGVNSETKALVSFSKDGNKGSLTENECKNRAEDFVSKYIDVNDYDLEVKQNSESYSFYYFKNIYNVPTCECVAITVSTAGDIIYFERQMSGVFEDLNVNSSTIEARVKELKSRQAMDVLKEKINSIYSTYSSYEIVSQYVVVLEDGSIGVKYDVAVRRSREYSTDEFIETSSATSIILK